MKYKKYVQFFKILVCFVYLWPPEYWVVDTKFEKSNFSPIGELCTTKFILIFFYGGSELEYGGIKLGYGYSGILNKLLLSNMLELDYKDKKNRFVVGEDILFREMQYLGYSTTTYNNISSNQADIFKQLMLKVRVDKNFSYHQF